MLPIGTDEHVFVAGMTGTGKTELAKAYLSQYPRVVKMDTKGEALDDLKKKKNPWPQVHPKELTIVQKLDDVLQVDTPYIIYAPVTDEMETAIYEVFFRWAYLTRNITVWIDELMEVTDNSQTICRSHKAILTRGRSRDTTVWQLTQRPVGVSPLCISQSKHIFSFDLALDQDRKKVADVTGCKEFLVKPDGYNFWYFRQGWRQAQLGVLGKPD